MTGVLAFLPVRLALVIGFAGIRLRQRFRRITRALVSQPPGPHALFTELQRIESDPAYRARFLTGLDAAILRRDAEHTAELHAVEAAIRCYGKVGFKPVGIMRAYGRDHRTGAWKDGLLMDLLADELV